MITSPPLLASETDSFLQAGEEGRKHRCSVLSTEGKRAPVMNCKCRLGCICSPAIAVRAAAMVHPRAQACKCKSLQGLKDVIQITNHISHLTICGTMTSFLCFQNSITCKYHKTVHLISSSYDVQGFTTVCPEQNQKIK